MSNQEVTLRQVFSLPDPGAKDSSPDRWKEFQESVSKEVKTIKWPAAMPDLAEKLCELFDVRLPDLFWMSWRKSDDLKKLLDESRQKPEATKDLELLKHTIVSEHHPYIEIRVQNMPAKKIEFTVKMSFTLEGFVLKIKAGQIEEILSGRCKAEGKVLYDGLPIATKQLSPIELPALFRFKSEPMPSIYQTSRVPSSQVAAV